MTKVINSLYASGYSYATGGLLSITSMGTIEGTGLATGDGTTVVNDGSIKAGASNDGVDVSVSGGAVITNGSGGTISGADGVIDGGAGAVTLINDGSITGSTDSVKFVSSSDYAQVNGGSSFVGEIVGGGGTLGFNGASGTITGFGGAGVFSVGASGDFESFGTYTFDGGAKWTVSGAGTIASDQTLNIVSGSSLTTTGTLSSSGQINLGSKGFIFGYAGAALYNAGTITGGGIIGTMAETNAAAGTIQSLSGNLLINNMNGSGLTNDGLIESHAGASLGIREVTVTGTGTIDAFGTVKLVGAALDGGSVNVESGGLLQVAAPTSSTASGVDISNAGSISINGGYLYISGNITGAGAISIDGTSTAVADLKAVGDVTLSGGGSVNMNPDGFITGYGSSSLTSDDIISGGGAIFGSMTVTNDGTIDGDFHTMLINNQYGGGLTNNGLIESTRNATLGLEDVSVTGTGSIEASDGTIKLVGASIEGGSISVDAHGVLDVASTTSNVGTGVDITNAGSIAISSGYLYLGGDISGAGAISIDGTSKAVADLKAVGNVTLSGGGTVNMNPDGFITGYGASSLTSYDTISGGGAIFGSMTVTNDGTIDGDLQTLLINNQYGGGLTNNGLLESTATGVVSLKEVTVTGSGSIDDDHAMKLLDATINGGLVTVGAAGMLEVVTGASTIGSGVTLTNDNTLEVASGSLAIDGAITNNGDMMLAGAGALSIGGAVTGTGDARLAGSGNLTIDGSMSQEVLFGATSTGDLVLGGSSDFTGRIRGFSSANAIDLQGLAFNASDTAKFSGTSSGGTLTIYSGGNAVLATLKFSGDYTTSTFTLANDGTGGTLITDPPAASQLSQAIAGFGAGSGASVTHSTPLAPAAGTVLVAPGHAI